MRGFSRYLLVSFAFAFLWPSRAGSTEIADGLVLPSQDAACGEAEEQSLQLIQRRATKFNLEHHEQQSGTPAEEHPRFPRMLTTAARVDFEACSRIGILQAAWSPFQRPRSSPAVNASGETKEQSVLKGSVVLAETLATRALRTLQRPPELHFRSLAAAGAAAWVTAVWVLLCAGLLCYFLASALAASRPMQKPCADSNSGDLDSRLQCGTPSVTVLEEPWSFGPLAWIGMGWMDKFIGAPHLIARLALPGSAPQVQCGEELRGAWLVEVEAKGLMNASMLRAIYTSIGTKKCALLVLCAWAAAFLELLGMVLALDAVLAALEAAALRADPLRETLMVVSLLFLVPLVYRCFSAAVAALDAQCAGLVTCGLAQLLYEKALRLPVGFQYHEGAASGAAAKALIANISQEWPQTFRALALFSAAPFVAAALVAMLVAHLKAAGLLGAFYLVPSLLLALLVVRGAVNWRSEYQSQQGIRRRRLSELFLQRRALRALGCEATFEAQVREARRLELGANQVYSVLVGTLVANLHSMTWLVAVGSLCFSIFLQGGADARDMWVVLQIVSSLQTCANLAVSGLRRLVCLPCSLSNVECFLKQPERPAEIVRALGQDSEEAVRLSGSFAFEEGGPAVLHDLDLTFSHHELVAVLGPAGSGKTALLQAALGELFPCGLSHISAQQRVAYCAQEPWIIKGTIRQNVVLSAGALPVSRRRYEEALAAASLLPDLAVLPGGDEACIDGSTILTPGQRSRLVLARAAYGTASADNEKSVCELLLLDDLLASLPATEAEAVLDRLLFAPHVKDKTRIVAMSRPSEACLRRFDRVVLLQGGRVTAQGSPADVLASEQWPEVAPLHVKAPQDEGMPLLESLESEDTKSITPTSSEAQDTSSSEHSLHVLGKALLSAQEEEPVASRQQSAAAVLLSPEPRKGDLEEVTAWQLVRSWISSGGCCNLVLAVLLLIAQRATQLWQMLLLAWWGDSAMGLACDHKFFAGSVLAVVLLNCSLLVAGEWASSRFARCAAEAAHDAALEALLARPWYQSPGSAIERMSMDLAQVDGAMVSMFLTGMRSALGTVLQQAYILSIAPLWVAMGVLLPLYCCVAYFAWLYQRAAMAAASSSSEALRHAQALMDETLDAPVSVRANSSCQHFLERFSSALLASMRTGSLLSSASKCWVCLRATFCLSLGAAVCALHVLRSGSAAEVGVGSLGLMVSLLFAFLADLEASCDVLAQGSLVLGALRRLSELSGHQSPAHCTGVTGSPGAGKRWSMQLQLSSKDVASLQLQGERESLSLASSGAALLRAAEGGSALALAEGRRFAELAPDGAFRPQAGAATLPDKEFLIVAVNGVAFNAEAMAHELLAADSSGKKARSQMLTLELRHRSCMYGVSIHLEHVYVGYGDIGPSVLQNACFDVPAHGRVALVGPTGSGKSTALSCLLGLLEPRSGCLRLAGRDMKSIRAAELRSLVGLVPQEPVLWEGTWRENLDPEGRFGDESAWAALAGVGLSDLLAAKPEGLSSQVAERGENLSPGERVLLNLARAALQRPQVLLVDDCLAALDPSAARRAMQATLTTAFSMSTVLGVASCKEFAWSLGFQRCVELCKGSVVIR